jgi:hypothetical protein
LDIANLSAQTSDETMATFSLGGLGIKGLGRDANNRINVDEADLSDLAFAFTDQLITAFSDPESDDDGKAAKTPQEDEPAPLNLRLGRLALAPGSTIQFTDTSVEPIARFDASIKKATVENFDTEAPSENTAIDFQVEFNETSEVSLSGWMAPLKEPLGFDIEGHMEQVALPDFSPYIAKLSGVNIETGQLNSDISALTDAKDLKGKLGVVISDLDLSSASDDTSQTFQADYGVPLELAISLLEDNEGKIALEFPIGGEVGAPKIGYADVIKAALRGVLTAFFPSFDFGTDTLDVRLDPIIFSAGERELDDAGRSLSQQIANLLNEKPKLSVKICGKATGADFLATEDAPGKAAIFDGEEQTDEEPQAGVPTSADEKQIAAEEVILTEAQAERMLDIATARTSAARSYMIEQAGISADRIGKCRVSYSIKDDKPPRVEVRF